MTARLSSQLPPELQAKLDSYRKHAVPVNNMAYDPEKGCAYVIHEQTEAGIKLIVPVVVKVPAQAILTFAANLILSLQGMLPGVTTTTGKQ